MPEIAEETLVGIKRIKELSFFINEPLFVPDPAKILKIELALQLTFIIELDLVTIQVRIYYHYPETPHELLTDIQVQNVFVISDLKKFQVAPVEIKLPANIITTLTGLSISHTRALLAKNISGTPLQENILAIINPEAVAKHFFPKMFETAPAETTAAT
jgi:hypothetical protein